MYLLYIKIFDRQYKDDIFLALESVEISRASYIEATNLEKSLNDELPLFRGFFTDDEEDKKVILITALVDEKEQIEEFISNLEESGLDIHGEDIFRLALLPVEMVFESKKHKNNG